MRSFLLALSCWLSCSGLAAANFNRDSELRAMRSDYQSENRVRLAYRTEAAIEGWVHTAVRELHRHGDDAQALALLDSWEGDNPWKGYLPALIQAHTLGLIDTREVPELLNPLSQVIADWYHDVLQALGPTLTHTLRLDDIQVINFSIPVVFFMPDVLGDVPMDLPTYTLYWTPFCGVVSYWSVWAVCEAATYGTGYVLVCMPAGMLAERVTVRYIAPPLADNAYAYFWE